MASTACFMIVSKNDIPIYEAEVGTVPKVFMRVPFDFSPSIFVDSPVSRRQFRLPRRCSRADAEAVGSRTARSGDRRLSCDAEIYAASDARPPRWTMNFRTVEFSCSRSTM